MKWWPRKRIARNTQEEAKAHLKLVTDREEEVQHLSRLLRKAQTRNHFSEMVQAAITRTGQEGR